MTRRLCACINIFPDMSPMFFWPPKSGRIDESKEVVMIAKTVTEKYAALEKTVEELHSYDVPCIIAIPTYAVVDSYKKWLIDELK